MKVTEKGQVTIPKVIRDRYGFRPGCEVRFVERDHRVVLEKTEGDVWDKYCGFLKTGERTDDVIRKLRGPRPWLPR